MKILILGVNGFIGNALAEKLLDDPDGSYEVYGSIFSMTSSTTVSEMSGSIL